MMRFVSELKSNRRPPIVTPLHLLSDSLPMIYEWTTHIRSLWLQVPVSSLGADRTAPRMHYGHSTRSARVDGRARHGFEGPPPCLREGPWTSESLKEKIDCVDDRRPLRLQIG